MRLAQVPEIPIDIEKKVEEAYSKERRVYPCRSNRASALGHPCERYLTYMRTSWEQQTLPPVDREFIFEGGRMIEKYIAIPRLEKAGFTISNQGRDFEDKKYSITGHVDGMLGTGGEAGAPQAKYPLEIKGISPFEWEKIDSAEDMLLSKRVWVRGYPAQLQLYLFLSEKPVGLFYLINKLTYKGKPIWLPIDYDFCEELVKKAERINKHVAENTLPERTLKADTCMKCSFRHICLPDLKNVEGIEFIDDAELEALIDRFEELRAGKKEYDAIDRQIKDMVEGRDNLNIGKWLISGQWIEKVIPAKEETTQKYWKKKIIRIG